MGKGGQRRRRKRWGQLDTHVVTLVVNEVTGTGEDTVIGYVVLDAISIFLGKGYSYLKRLYSAIGQKAYVISFVVVFVSVTGMVTGFDLIVVTVEVTGQVVVLRRLLVTNTLHVMQTQKELQAQPSPLHNGTKRKIRT